MRDVILAVDQGTGSTRSVLLDGAGSVRQAAQVPISLDSPAPGWVQQTPQEILDSVITALRAGVAMADGPIAGIGLSSQRESALVWEHTTGCPVSPLLGWQDRRTAERAAALTGVADEIRDRSGLPLDPMFSALKLAWILDEIDPDRARSRRGELRVGTVDAWVLRCLTGDDTIEVGNASRTQLLNVRDAQWDDILLDAFRIPREALPAVVPSDRVSSPINGFGSDLDGLRFGGVLGDSHAALFAHGVREAGSVKVTYGTGSSIMGLAAQPVGAQTGLVETIGWQRGDVARAFEGNILSTGGTLVWLGKLLDKTPDELARLALTASDDHRVDLVPAFAGLGAPWWDDSAHAIIDGFDLGTGQADLARAALESIPLQIEDVLERADAVSGSRIATVLVDGGPARNDWLMQLQATIGSRTILRPHETGLSALGAGAMAGLGLGVWSDSDLAARPMERDRFAPTGDAEWAKARRKRWSSAIARARTRTT